MANPYLSFNFNNGCLLVDTREIAVFSREEMTVFIVLKGGGSYSCKQDTVETAVILENAVRDFLRIKRPEV